METLIEIAIKIVIDILLVGFVGLFFSRKEANMKSAIEEEFRKRDKFFDTRFNFKRRALEELLGPIKMQLMRSKFTVKKYDANNEYREKILKECNETILDLLLEKGFLIPTELLSQSEAFIQHYDNWLQEYKKKRIDTNDKETKLVFTYDFPHKAENAFVEKYEKVRRELDIEGDLRN